MVLTALKVYMPDLIGAKRLAYNVSNAERTNALVYETKTYTMSYLQTNTYDFTNI